MDTNVDADPVRSDGKQAAEPSLVRMAERAGGVLGLITALVPLTLLWDGPWWARVPLVVVAGVLLWVAVRDFLPRPARRGPVVLGYLLVLAMLAALGPGVASAVDRPAPDTAGRASITSPRNAQSISLLVREEGTFSDGFIASGSCQVPPGYRAVIVSLADDGKGYWLLSDKILGDCVDDGASHQWTAKRIDPTWPGMAPNKPVVLGVTVLRKDLAEAAKAKSVPNADPVSLPPPAASVRISVSRVLPH